MAKKAGGKVTTWIKYSQAKADAGEYLGDPEVAERKIRKGLAAGIPWQCVDFEAPPQYSGPGPGDPKFWREPDSLLPSGALPIMRLEWLVIKASANYRSDITSPLRSAATISPAWRPASLRTAPF